MSKYIHMGISTRGLLGRISRGNKREKKQAVAGISTNGRQATVEEVQDWLMDHLALGHETLPLHEPPCEGWSWQSGCPGHETQPDTEAL